MLLGRRDPILIYVEIDISGFKQRCVKTGLSATAHHIAGDVFYLDRSPALEIAKSLA